MTSNRNKLTIRIKSAVKKFDAGDFEGAVKDYTEAIDHRLADKSELNLVDKNRLAEAYIGRGRAKNELGDYDEAIENFEAAIRLNPAQNLLVTALNNLAAIKAEKSSRDAVEERLGSLADTKEIEKQVRRYETRERLNRFTAYYITMMLIFIVYFLVLSPTSPGLRSEFLPIFFSKLEFIDIKTPFDLLPLISIIIIITSPFVWLIRLLLTEANKKELMAVEYRHLALVEKRMFFYFAKDDTNEGKKIRADYIKATMTNSPADKLLAFQSKTSVPSPNPAQNIVEKAVNKARDKSSS